MDANSEQFKMCVRAAGQFPQHDDEKLLNLYKENCAFIADIWKSFAKIFVIFAGGFVGSIITCIWMEIFGPAPFVVVMAAFNFVVLYFMITYRSRKDRDAYEHELTRRGVKIPLEELLTQTAP